MVDAYARIASKSIPKVIPERVDRLVRMQFSDSIRPTLRKKLLIVGGMCRWISVSRSVEVAIANLY